MPQSAPASAAAVLLASLQQPHSNDNKEEEEQKVDHHSINNVVAAADASADSIDETMSSSSFSSSSSSSYESSSSLQIQLAATQAAAEQARVELEIARLQREAQQYRNQAAALCPSLPLPLAVTPAPSSISASLPAPPPSSASAAPFSATNKRKQADDTPNKCVKLGCARVFTGKFCSECGTPAASSPTATTSQTGMNTYTHTYIPPSSAPSSESDMSHAATATATAAAAAILSLPIAAITPLAKAEAERAKIIASKGSLLAEIIWWSREYSRQPSATMQTPMSIIMNAGKPPKNPTQPNNFTRHMQLWMAYVQAENAAHIHDPTQHARLKSLLTYTEELTRLAQMYTYKVVLKYDREHRYAAIVNNRALDDHYPQGVLSLLAEPPIKCPRCHTHGHVEHDCTMPDDQVEATHSSLTAAGSNYPPRPAYPSSSSSHSPKSTPCRHFNAKENGCITRNCMFSHHCSFQACGRTGHGEHSCYKKFPNLKPSSSYPNKRIRNNQ
jgi:hypothetical protein